MWHYCGGREVPLGWWDQHFRERRRCCEKHWKRLRNGGDTLRGADITRDEGGGWGAFQVDT